MEKNITIEASEFLPRIKADIEQRFPIISGFLLLMIVLKVVFKVSLPNSLFLLVSLMLLTSIPVAFSFDKLQKRAKKAVNLYFGYLLLDLVWLTIIIYFAGGIAWIIPSIYIFYVINLFWLFPKFQATLLVGWVSLLLILLAFGTYFGIFPHVDIFLSEEKNPQNFPFVLTSTIIALASMSFLGYSSNTFYLLLDKKIKALREKGKKLILTKRFLEIEVGKRTRELQGERKKMAKEVEEKTRELQERRKLGEAEVRKLTKFHKTAVSRELKMVEIKEKIQRLKELKLKK